MGPRLKGIVLSEFHEVKNNNNNKLLVHKNVNPKFSGLKNIEYWNWGNVNIKSDVISHFNNWAR